MNESNLQPLEKIFHFYKNDLQVEIWERGAGARHVGHIAGFDEYMNIVFRSRERKFLIKGDCIACILLVDES